jgi:hypothetical protein
VSGDEQHAHRGAHRKAGSVRPDHHGAPRQPVAENAADREGRHLRHRPGGETEPDLGRTAAEVEDREGDGDRCQIRTEIRDPASREEEPEVALTESLHAQIFPRQAV